jgi:hypothetical protein
MTTTLAKVFKGAKIQLFIAGEAVDVLDASKPFFKPYNVPKTDTYEGGTIDISWFAPYLTVYNCAMETPQEEIGIPVVARLIKVEENNPDEFELDRWRDYSIKQPSLEWLQMVFTTFFEEGEQGLALDHKRTIDFAKAYLENGPPSYQFPLYDDYFSKPHFPLPNVAKTNSSGSLRMVTARDEDYVTLYMRAKEATHNLSVEKPTASSEYVKNYLKQGHDYISFECLRGQHAFYREQNYRLWNAVTDPGIPYGGYGASRGGFHNLFDIPKPKSDCLLKEKQEYEDQKAIVEEFSHECPEISWNGNGYGVCDPQHLALDRSVTFAILARCQPAAMSAICGFEAIMKVMKREKFAGMRAYGHALRCAAVIVGALNDFEIYKEDVNRILNVHIPSLLTEMEKRNRVPDASNMYRYVIPGCDHGGATDGGHLDRNDMQSYYDLLDIHPSLHSLAAQSCSNWMVQICIIGCDAVLSLIPEHLLSETTRKRTMVQLRICGEFSLGPCTGKAFNVHTGKVEYPAKGVWDEIAPVDDPELPYVGVPCAEDGGKNFNTGVAARWGTIGYEILSRRMPFAKDRKKALEIADILHARTNGWYNAKQSYRYNADSYLHGARLGYVN